MKRLLRFGKGDELFGAFHATGDAAARVVVFCAPFGEEKKCSYRTFVETARELAETGVAALRFDYFGTGDSDGHFSEFAPRRAIGDIAAAAVEARELAGTEHVVLLGLRLGGALALAAAKKAAASHVILWQPVLDGKRFFGLTVKRQMLRQQLIGVGETGGDGGGVIDLDGFPLSKAAGEELAELDGVAAAGALEAPISLIQLSHSETVSAEYRRFAETVGDRVAVHPVVCPPFWNRIDREDVSAAAFATRRVLFGQGAPGGR
jgi:alpha/beta superfamily hydrolase